MCPHGRVIWYASLLKNRNNRQPGVYVEIRIRESMDKIWELTQVPELHQRWDLRFNRIRYLPRASLAEPQRFLYETRVGLGLSIKGTEDKCWTTSTEQRCHHLVAEVRLP